MKTKIGVLGCCVSRDSFNSRIVHNYKDFFKVQISAQRTSLISIFQDPVIFDEKDIEILPLNFANKATTQFISEDLNKKFIEDLDEKEIDFLVIDTYIDVTMGILFFNNQIISKAWDFEKTNFFNNIPNFFIIIHVSFVFFKTGDTISALLNASKDLSSLIFQLPSRFFINFNTRSGFTPSISNSNPKFIFLGKVSDFRYSNG